MTPGTSTSGWNCDVPKGEDVIRRYVIGKDEQGQPLTSSSLGRRSTAQKLTHTATGAGSNALFRHSRWSG
jgi:hypothetical protein